MVDILSTTSAHLVQVLPELGSSGYVDRNMLKLRLRSVAIRNSLINSILYANTFSALYVSLFLYLELFLAESAD